MGDRRSFSQRNDTRLSSASSNSPRSFDPYRRLSDGSRNFTRDDARQSSTSHSLRQGTSLIRPSENSLTSRIADLSIGQRSFGRSDARQESSPSHVFRQDTSSTRLSRESLADSSRIRTITGNIASPSYGERSASSAVLATRDGRTAPMSEIRLTAQGGLGGMDNQGETSRQQGETSRQQETREQMVKRHQDEQNRMTRMFSNLVDKGRQDPNFTQDNWDSLNRSYVDMHRAMSDEQQRQRDRRES